MGRKRSKNSRGWKRSKVDMISNLPDSLLLMILSLLPFESAVRSCVLSKRWRPLCVSLSNLRFKYGRKSGPHFLNSVDSFFMRRPVDLNIEKLSLDLECSCSGTYESTHVDEWIRKALDHRVKDLTLSFFFRGESSYELLPDIYTYGSFETLRLQRRILVDIPNHFSRFSRLKVLEFCYVTFWSYESVEDLLLNCPVLEDLVIKQCKTLSGSCLVVCGPALKNLELKCNERANRGTPLEIAIDTPGLESLKIGDSTWADIFIDSTLLSLTTARIAVGMERLQFNDSLFTLLDNIYHVKFLTLTDKAVGALESASGYHLPTFHNLIQLKLIVDNWSCWKLLPNILASSPNLQSLLLPWGLDLTHSDEDYSGLWSLPRVVPQCLSSHLKNIEIGAFHGTVDELSLVEHFLCDGRVLRKISIIFSNDCLESGRESRIRKKLESLGRLSKTCKIVIE